jgi:hypothetical protein
VNGLVNCGVVESEEVVWNMDGRDVLFLFQKIADGEGIISKNAFYAFISEIENNVLENQTETLSPFGRMKISNRNLELNIGREVERFETEEDETATLRM